MKRNNPSYQYLKLPSFTVLEITIVLALTSLLISLFFSALNRFNVMIANEGKIKTELNEWFKVRSTIWRDLDEADSIQVGSNSATIYVLGSPIKYHIEELNLQRTKNETTISFPIEMNEISKIDESIVFNFNWKGEEMLLSYPFKKRTNAEINTYFSEQKWK